MKKYDLAIRVERVFSTNKKLKQHKHAFKTEVNSHNIHFNPKTIQNSKPCENNLLFRMFQKRL